TEGEGRPVRRRRDRRLQIRRWGQSGAGRATDAVATGVLARTLIAACLAMLVGAQRRARPTAAGLLRAARATGARLPGADGVAVRGATDGRRRHRAACGAQAFALGRLTGALTGRVPVLAEDGGAPLGTGVVRGARLLRGRLGRRRVLMPSPRASVGLAAVLAP